MHASEFARRRARIEQRAQGRGDFRRKAMARLVREAGAKEVRVHGQVVGWAMSTGGMVCAKQRYKDWLDAQLAMQHIVQHANHSHTPARVYSCVFCRGFHLTSSAR